MWTAYHTINPKRGGSLTSQVKKLTTLQFYLSSTLQQLHFHLPHTVQNTWHAIVHTCMCGLFHCLFYSLYNTTATTTKHGTAYCFTTGDSEHDRSCHTTRGITYIVSLPHCDTILCNNSRHPKRGTACSYIQQLPPSMSKQLTIILSLLEL